MVLAAAVTASAAVAIGLPIVTIYRAPHRAAFAVTIEPGEIVTFLKPLPRGAMPVLAPSLSHSPPASPRSKPVERQLNQDTSSLTPARLEATGANPAAEQSSPTASVIGLITLSPAVSRPAGATQATPYSVYAQPAKPLPWPRRVPPTAEELDSAARDQAQRTSAAREEHRPMAIPLGGGSLPLPFLSRGPSREQRRVDSVIHADNLRRLSRLAERARAKRDSLLGANTLAGTAKRHVDARGDSARPPIPEPRPNE